MNSHLKLLLCHNPAHLHFALQLIRYPLMLQLVATRCAGALICPISKGVLMTTLCVSNLSPYTSQRTLSTLFGKFGPVLSCRIIKDRETMKPAGFAFVELESEAGSRAIRDLSSCTLDGNLLRVAEARLRAKTWRAGSLISGYAGGMHGERTRLYRQ